MKFDLFPICVPCPSTKRVGSTASGHVPHIRCSLEFFSEGSLLDLHTNREHSKQDTSPEKPPPGTQKQRCAEEIEYHIGVHRVADIAVRPADDDSVGALFLDFYNRARPTCFHEASELAIHAIQAHSSCQIHHSYGGVLG